MKHEKICPYCGSAFVSEQNAKKYCRKKCAVLAAKKREKKQYRFLCQWCGQFFKAHRRRMFCKAKCKAMYFGKMHLVKKTVIKVPVKITIEDAVKNSRCEGLTYGRYVSLKKI